MATTDSIKTDLARTDAAPAEKPMSIGEKIERQKAEIARALPNHISPERFTRIALTQVRANPKLAGCTAGSVLGGLMIAAQLGLEPGGPLGQCYLIPRQVKVPLEGGGTERRWEAQFQLGYRGIIDLALRSEQVMSIEARDVCAGDEFEFAYGLEDRLVHRPELEDRGELVAVYGICRFVNGGHYWQVMSRGQVEDIRDRFAAAPTGPWATDFEAMARKTVIRAMAPYLPKVVDLARGVAADDRVHEEIVPDMADGLEFVDLPDTAITEDEPHPFDPEPEDGDA